MATIQFTYNLFKLKKNVILFLLSLFAIQHGIAQQINIESSIDKPSITIGDNIKLQLTVRLNPSAHRIQFPILNDTFNHFELISKEKTDTIIQGDLLQFKQVYNITSFDSGQWTIPSLQFQVQPIQGDTPYIIESKPIIVQVQTVAVDTSKPFRPIASIRAAKMPLSQLLTYIGIALLALIALIIISWLIIKRIREKNKKQAIKTPEIILLPHEKALKAFQLIDEKKLWQHEQQKVYYTEVTDTLRTYLEEQFNIDCYEKTTSEIIQQVKKQKVLNPYRQQLRDLFQLADMVKFAKGQPEEQDHIQTMEQSIEFIHSSYKKVKSSMINTQTNV